MFDELVIHPIARTFLEAYMKHPKNGLLLTGSVGAGLGTVAHALAAAMTTHRTHILTIRPDEKGTIPIERVRALYVETRAIRSERFVIVIDNADTMSHDAQNAFLKLLEGPTEQVFFILTSHTPNRLLATIASRVQRVDLLPISRTESESLLRAHHVTGATKLQQMLFIAAGLPAELIRLAGDDAYFEEKARFVRLARDFLAAKPYDRLVLTSKIASRDEAILFVATIASVLNFTAKRQKTADEASATVLETVAARLLGNAHVRSQLTYLSLNVV